MSTNTKGRRPGLLLARLAAGGVWGAESGGGVEMSSVTIRDDPRLRRDGRCTRCKGERRGSSAKVHKRYIEIGHYELDPFCSTECCREWHGCVLPSTGSGSGSLGYEPPQRVVRHGTDAMYKSGCRCGECREGSNRRRRDYRRRTGK